MLKIMLKVKVFLSHAAYYKADAETKAEMDIMKESGLLAFGHKLRSVYECNFYMAPIFLLIIFVFGYCFYNEIT